MNGKTFFVDLTKCTACRGCQVACKQWKKLPAEKTKNWGSHQNPPDLGFNTLKVVRFKEEMVDGKLMWNFFPEQCRHCVDPPCIGGTELDGSIIHDEATGAVIYTEMTAKEDFESILFNCPYNIPRMDPETKVVSKCDMCIDRVRAGMLPACVLTCPTGAMNFGDREDMLAMAGKKLAAAKKKFPDAELVDTDDVRVIYLTAMDPEGYYEYLVADAGSVKPTGMTRKQFFAKLGSPVKKMTNA